MNDYRDLIVWQKAMKLVEEVYLLTRLLPDDELYVLSNQLRRAVISIPSNIAEGFGRNSTKDNIRFLRIAHGSKCETETQLFICVRLGYFSQSQITAALSLCEETGKMLNSLISKLSMTH